MAGPWFYRSAATGTGDGLSWANARTTLATLTGVAAGDLIWVADDHLENTAGALTIALPGTVANPNIVICADHTVAAPGSADYRATAVINGATTGSTIFTVNGSAYFYGIMLRAGLGSGLLTNLKLCQTAGQQIYENYVLAIATTLNGATVTLQIGVSGAAVPTKVVFANTQVSLAAVAQQIVLAQGIFEWRNTANPLPAAQPTLLFNPSQQGFVANLDALNLGSMGSGKTLVAAGNAPYLVTFNGCQIGSGVAVSPAIVTPASAVIVSGSDYYVGGPNFQGIERLEKYCYEGVETTDVANCLAASDGSVGFSRKYAPSANIAWQRPYAGLPIARWNDAIGSPITVSVHGLCNGAATPNNDQIWFDLSYLGTANSTAQLVASCTKANLSSTGAPYAADAAAWTAPLRINGRSYAVGDTLAVASNPGRVFVCTASGAAAGSEPAGYAAAIDGGSVTDGGATFRAAARFVMQVTVTPVTPGPFTIVPRLGAQLAATWLDPVF